MNTDQVRKDTNCFKFFFVWKTIPYRGWSYISILWQLYVKKQKQKKKRYGPFFMDGAQLPQDYSHFKEAVYFLPLSS